MNVIVEARGKGRDTTGINAQSFTMEFALNDGAASVNERQAITAKTLQDEAFAAKETNS